MRHGIRNELHQISIGLHLYRELTAAGLSQEANETFATIQEALSRLDENQALCRPKHATACSPSCSVLIVEDEENEREMLASLLRMRGYQVTTRADGQEALDYLAEHPKPQAILVDMKMPRCDGPELVRQLRTQRQIESVPVFAVSGTSPKENGLATGPEGVNRWFPKPLNPEYLLEALDALVSS